MASDYPGAAPPPPGVTADIENPQDVLWMCNMVTQGLTLVFVTAFIGFRIFAKSKTSGWTMYGDDYATYAAYVLMVGYCVTAVYAGIHGGGYNIWDVSPDDVQGFFKSGYAATIFYAPMAMTVKLALVIMIIRVFGAVHKKTRFFLYTFVAMVVTYYVTGVFIKIFVCWPIPSYWQGHRENCLNESAIITADAIISAVSDLVILLAPTPLTWSLQLPVRKRLRVIGILCAGGVATAFSIYRLIMILVEGNSPNGTIVFIKVILSGNAEIGIGLICTCLPAMTAYWKSRNGGSRYGYGNSSNAYGASSRVENEELGNNEIKMTRTFQVRSDPSAQAPKEKDLESGSDEAGLVHDQQAVPKSFFHSRRSDSL